MRDYNQLKEAVKTTLKACPETRNSDWLLVKEVMNYYIDVFGNSFADICDQAYNSGFSYPAFESITRCRRKLQAVYPELRADKKVIEYRKEQEEETKELMKGEF